VAEHHHLLFLQHTGAGPAPAIPATNSRSLPQREKLPCKPTGARCYRCPCRESRAVPVAVGMDGRACREGHWALRLCRLPRVLWERAGAVFAWVASLFLGGVPSGRTW